MKNKYQDALDGLVKNIKIYTGLELSKQDKENLATLQELVDEKIPVKVVKWKLAQPETRCVKCGAGLERKHDYCWGCGQKLDWSDDDES